MTEGCDNPPRKPPPVPPDDEQESDLPHNKQHPLRSLADDETDEDDQLDEVLRAVFMRMAEEMGY